MSLLGKEKQHVSEKNREREYRAVGQGSGEMRAGAVKRNIKLKLKLSAWKHCIHISSFARHFFLHP